MDVSYWRGLKRKFKNATDGLWQHPALVLLFIFLFHAANTLIFVFLDKAPLVVDEAMFFERSGYLLREIGQGDIAGFIFFLKGGWPPLHRLISIPFYILFGYSPDVAVLSMLPAALVLIFSMYHIGKELQDSKTGLVAAALTPLLPGIFSISRTYLQEFTLAATVALSLALMLKTKGFSHRGYTFTFGMSIGLGLLAKWSYTVFVIGPFLLYLWESYKGIVHVSNNPKEECILRAKWVLVSVLCGFLLASSWYASNLDDVAQQVKASSFETEENYNALSSENLLFYIKSLHLFHLKAFFLIVSAACVIRLLSARSKAAVSLYLWVIIPWLVFTFGVVDNKRPRHVVGYLPAFALFIAIGCMTLSPKAKRIVMPFILFVAIMQFFAISYVGEPVHPVNRERQGSPTVDSRDWNLDEVAATINSLLENKPCPAVMVINRYHLGNTLRYLQLMDVLVPFRVDDIQPHEHRPELQGIPYNFYLEQLTHSDIVLTSEDVMSLAAASPDPPDSSIIWYWNSTAAYSIVRNWSAISGAFQPVRSIVLPDGDSLIIYEKTVFGSAMQDLSRGVAEAYYDENSKSHVVMTGSEAHLRITLKEGAEPSSLVLMYSAYRPPGSNEPRFSIAINGILAANVSEKPPYPWTLLNVIVPKGLVHNGTLDVDIKSNTYVDDKDEKRGIALDWISVICEQGSDCINDWRID